MDQYLIRFKKKPGSATLSGAVKIFSRAGAAKIKCSTGSASPAVSRLISIPISIFHDMQARYYSVQPFPFERAFLCSFTIFTKSFNLVAQNKLRKCGIKQYLINVTHNMLRTHKGKYVFLEDKKL